MDLDLFDAIRLHRIIEVDADGGRYSIEPHNLSAETGKSVLRAFAIAGPVLGWKDFTEWSNLRLTDRTFTPRR